MIILTDTMGCKRSRARTSQSWWSRLRSCPPCWPLSRLYVNTNNDDITYYCLLKKDSTGCPKNALSEFSRICGEAKFVGQFWLSRPKLTKKAKYNQKRAKSTKNNKKKGQYGLKLRIQWYLLKITKITKKFGLPTYPRKFWKCFFLVHTVQRNLLLLLTHGLCVKAICWDSTLLYFNLWWSQHFLRLQCNSGSWTGGHPGRPWTVHSVRADEPRLWQDPQRGSCRPAWRQGCPHIRAPETCGAC